MKKLLFVAFLIVLLIFFCVAGWVGYLSLLVRPGMEYTLMCNDVEGRAILYVAGQRFDADYRVFCQ